MLSGTSAPMPHGPCACWAHSLPDFDTALTLVPSDLALSFEVPDRGVTVPSRQATVLALLINELVANAIRHGLRGRRRGRLVVTAERAGEEITLRVEDDGHGPPADFDLKARSGLGLTIARTLVRADLHGTIAVERNAAGGTTVTITFPAAVEEQPPAESRLMRSGAGSAGAR